MVIYNEYLREAKSVTSDICESSQIKVQELERICQDLTKENLKLKEKLSQNEEDKDAKNHEKSKLEQYKIKNSHNIEEKEGQLTNNICIEDNDANAKAKLTKSQSLNLNDIDKKKSNIVVQNEYIIISDSLEPDQNQTEVLLIKEVPSVDLSSPIKSSNSKLVCCDSILSIHCLY